MQYKITILRYTILKIDMTLSPPLLFPFLGATTFSCTDRENTWPQQAGTHVLGRVCTDVRKYL